MLKKKAILNNKRLLVTFLQKNKKCISPVVAMALLLVVTVVAVISFQSWFTTYQSEVFTDVEQTKVNDILSVEGIIDNKLYLKSSSNQVLKYLKINSGSNGSTLCEFKAIDDDELVLWLPFEEIDSNNLTRDVSGRGNDGLVGSALSLKSGPEGNYLTGFDGVDNNISHLVAVNHPDLSNFNTLTVEGWNYFNGSVWGGSFFVGIPQYKLGISNPKFVFSINGSSVINYSQPNAINFTWNHLLATYNGTHSLLYSNGNLIASRYNNTLGIGNNPYAYIGNRYSNRNWEGHVDEIKIYQRALTSTEVMQTYLNPSMYLIRGINELNINRSCNLTKGQVINVFGYTDNGKFESKKIVN